MIDGNTEIVELLTYIANLPAYNAAKTLKGAIVDAPPGVIDEFLITWLMESRPVTEERLL